MTTRTKVIIGIILVITAIVLIAVTTPDECDVDVSQMSAACKSLIYS